MGMYDYNCCKEILAKKAIVTHLWFQPFQGIANIVCK